MAETLLDMLEGCKPGNTRKMTYKGAYRFLYALLTNRAISLFDWRGLPFEQHELEIPIQINTVISRYNIEYLDEMAKMVEELGCVLWSVFFFRDFI